MDCLCYGLFYGLHDGLLWTMLWTKLWTNLWTKFTFYFEGGILAENSPYGWTAVH